MNRLGTAVSAAVLMVGLSACDQATTDQTAATDETAAVETVADIVVTQAELEGNPFVAEWDTPYGVPPFDEIEDAHYLPAIKAANPVCPDNTW